MRSNGNDLRELIRIVVQNLGLLEKGNACCSGVTLVQCHAIVEIGRAEEITLNVLAEILNVDKSTMSRTIDNLVRQNFVSREIHSENRRYIRIALTEDGKKIYEKVEKSMENYYDSIISKVPENKRNEVLESLKLLVEIVKSKHNE